MQRKMEFVFKTKQHWLLYAKPIRQIFFLSTLDTNINCMG